MHGSLGHFKATLQRKKERKAKADSRFDKKRLQYKASGVKSEFNFPVLKNSELERLKKGIRTKIKNERLKSYLFLFIIFLILLFLIYYLINFVQ